MSNIVHFIHGGGVVMYPLLLLSFIAFVIVTERFLAYRQLGYLAPGLLDQTVLLSREERFDDALKLCRDQRGPLAACLAVILKHRSTPTREVERLVEEAGQNYFIRLEKLLPILDTTTTIAPLLGLLGTIIGMIGTFNAIAIQQSRGNTDAVLSGVGEALYATATGLSVAVVCFVAYNYFSARLRTITAETERAATQLINVLVELRHFERGSEDHESRVKEEKKSHGFQTKT